MYGFGIAHSPKYGFFGWNLWRQPIGFLVIKPNILVLNMVYFILFSYLNLLVSSLFVTVLYLGGWNFSIPYISFFGFFQMNKIIGILEMVIGIFITLTKMDFTQDENGSVIKSWMEISFTYFSGQSLINNFFPTSFTINKNTITRFRGRIHFEFDKCIACEVCVSRMPDRSTPCGLEI
ncbi:hypothetical protein ACJX0J_001325 [Zea mays]